MLIEKLPWIVVWLDWNFYAYRTSLFVCIVISVWVKYVGIMKFPSTTWSTFFSFDGVLLLLFVGFCMWVSYCAVRYGYAVG